MKTKVVLLDLPTTLWQIVERTVGLQPDMELIGERAAGVDPDVVVAGIRSIDDATTAAALLRRWPRSRVLVVGIENGDAAMFDLQPHRTPLGELSPARLLDAIRAGTRNGMSPMR
jgi:hypothetical protein